MSDHVRPWARLAIALSIAMAALVGFVHVPAWGKRVQNRGRHIAVRHSSGIGVPLALASDECPGANAAPIPGHVGPARAATLCLINAERRAAGLAPLRNNRKLDRAAKRHSHDMVDRNYFAHDAPWSPFERRIRRSGYLAHAAGYDLGENIGLGTGGGATPAAMVAAWMNSPEHRANILDGSYRDSGIGVAAHVPARFGGGLGGTYTEDFGHRL
jgi:uncharacterized protein YkwD